MMRRRTVSWVSFAAAFSLAPVTTHAQAPPEITGLLSRPCFPESVRHAISVKPAVSQAFSGVAHV